jgi:septum formation inhibitor MinC
METSGEDMGSEELVQMALSLARANSEIQEWRNMAEHRLVQLQQALENTPLRCLDALRKAQENNEALMKKLADLEAENVLLRQRTELLEAEVNMLFLQTQPSTP